MEPTKETHEHIPPRKRQVIYETASLPQEERERRLQLAFDLLFQFIKEELSGIQNKNNNSP